MEDLQIIQLYWDRNPDAIPATSEKYGAYCHAISYNILGIDADAEECVNDTWFHAWNAMPPHRPSLLSAFLGKITRNLSLSRYKMTHAQKRGGGEMTLVLEELSECVSGGESAEDTADRHALVEALQSFLDGLPPKKRALFVRRYWHTERISSLAKAFGMTENHVSVTLNRLRAQLKNYLTERGFSV